MKFLLAALLSLSLSACATSQTPTTPAVPVRTLTPVSYSELSGWDADKVAEALPAFRRSCASLSRKADWVQACAALNSVPDNDDRAARAYFTTWFRPYSVSDGSTDDGLFTGYYEAELHGAATRHGNFQTPIYARPDDLVAVDLGDFKDEWKGKHISGKVVGHNLKPYDDRAAIVRNGLGQRARILAWVNDPVSAFFLAVQGSGRIRMENGQVLRVGYDGANGRDYVSIGKKMLESGELPQPVTMPSIRAWLAAHPDRAESTMDMNPSFVFFRTLDGDGPIGAEGVALTPMRSMAVDPANIPLGSPVWLDTRDGHDAVLRRLMVAQDTGGAIKGIVRGDFFWGFGQDAETQAGLMQSRGRYFLLMPKHDK